VLYVGSLFDVGEGDGKVVLPVEEPVQLAMFAM